LWGGGFIVAFTQLSVFYYALGAVLHFILPSLSPVRGIQEQQRRPGEVGRDAINSLGEYSSTQRVVTADSMLLDVTCFGSTASTPLRTPAHTANFEDVGHATAMVCVAAGPLVVKAAIWAVVEQMYARGISKLYAGPVDSIAEVSQHPIKTAY
jgi:hypothetical protein